MLNLLKNLFSSGRVNKKFNEDVELIIQNTHTTLETNIRSTTKRKLHSLQLLNDEVSEAARQMKIVSEELIKKLNNEVEGLNTELNVISQTATEGIITINHRGCIINLNQAAETMFGYFFDELNGVDISKIIPISIPGYHEGIKSFPDLMESVTQNIFNNLKYKSGHININNYFSLSKTNQKMVGKTKDGSTIFLEMNVNIINPNVGFADKIQLSFGQVSEGSAYPSESVNYLCLSVQEQFAFASRRERRQRDN